MIGVLVPATTSNAFTLTVTGVQCGTPAIDAAGNVSVACNSGTTPPPDGGGTEPPPIVDEIDCSTIQHIDHTKKVDLPWAATVAAQSTRNYGGFGASDAFVFVLTPTNSTQGKNSFFTATPTDGYGYNDRTIAVSNVPCDMAGATLGTGSVVRGQGPSLYFTVGGRGTDRYGNPITNVPDLQIGHTYYFTVVQQNPIGTNTCHYSSCDVNYAIGGAVGQ